MHLDVNNKDLPYCHFEETKNKYSFENIEEWVESKAFEENFAQYWFKKFINCSTLPLYNRL